MTLPFAALAALIAALIETSVLPFLPIAGATADVVLVCAIAATVVFGTEDGLAAAFVGGLLVDLLVAARPAGATTFSLLIVIGAAIVAARVLGEGRRWMAVALSVVLTAVLHVLLALVLVATQDVPFVIQPTVILVAAFMNGVLAIPVVALFSAIERRFGPAERAAW